MPKENTTERKSFFDKHTIAGVIILVLIGLIAIEAIVGFAFNLLFRSLGFDGTAAGNIASIVAAVLALVIWRKRNADYRPRADAGSFLRSLKFAAPIVLLWIAIVSAYGICAGGVPFRMIGLGTITTAIMAGFVEEIVFREIATSYLARQWRDESKIILMALVPGILFGITHLVNVQGLEGLPDTLGQVLICIFAGLFYGAIFLRCGNIWPLICVHAVHDIVASSAEAGVDIATLPGWTDVVIVVGFVVLGLYGLFLIRKTTHAEIIELWDKKWSRNEA